MKASAGCRREEYVTEWGLSFDLQGHRGCRGLRPENTLAGFQHALAVGVSTLELDVGLTADDVPVVSHDPALNPAITRGADRAWIERAAPLIRAVPAADLAGFDVGRIRPDTAYSRQFPDQVPVDGAAIPTFAEVVALARSAPVPVRLNIELKSFPDRPELTAAPGAMADAVLRVLDRHFMADRTTIQSFDWRSLDHLARRRPELARSYLTDPRGLSPLWLGGREPRGRPAWELVLEAGGKIWSPHFRSLDAATVRQAHDAGLAVWAWTVNGSAEMERVLDIGADAIITDRPDRLRAVLAARNMQLPAAA
jgi:glycerophosphoryl diester phosphodiesterase